MYPQLFVGCCCLFFFFHQIDEFWGAINSAGFLHCVRDEKYRSDNEHNKGPLMSTGTKKATLAFQQDRTFIQAESGYYSLYHSHKERLQAAVTRSLI